MDTMLCKHPVWSGDGLRSFQYLSLLPELWLRPAEACKWRAVPQKLRSNLIPVPLQVTQFSQLFHHLRGSFSYLSVFSLYQP